jgi:hypothetical protein
MFHIISTPRAHQLYRSHRHVQHPTGSNQFPPPNREDSGRDRVGGAFGRTWPNWRFAGTLRCVPASVVFRPAAFHSAATLRMLLPANTSATAVRYAEASGQLPRQLHPARFAAHLCVAGGVGRRQCLGVATDARTHVSEDDARHLRRPVRRRPRRGCGHAACQVLTGDHVAFIGECAQNVLTGCSRRRAAKLKMPLRCGFPVAVCA